MSTTTTTTTTTTTETNHTGRVLEITSILDFQNKVWLNPNYVMLWPADDTRDSSLRREREKAAEGIFAQRDTSVTKNHSTDLVWCGRGICNSLAHFDFGLKVGPAILVFPRGSPKRKEDVRHCIPRPFVPNATVIVN